ncbi:triose-phosphate isomerase [Aminipila butyrica]|uniref:Triosephosphate isomerase n=1 Tax=Aminipila butyrica TaxID=433296 RepID=A0A858BYU7_9FIRM|nr:triose-phosphate isomerase [Aminipila butyrica]QIB70767.1 triose-phosphate isomerase [Aminipila butyrica]
MRKPLIAGNWKMFKTTAEAKDFAAEFKKIYVSSDIQVAVCAPFTQLEALKEAFQDTDIQVGAQNLHFAEEGAFTGEISAAMLKEIGVDCCIIGHSERRQLFGETDEMVNKKLHQAFASGIRPILCVGESLEQRDGGQAFDLVRSQMKAGMQGLHADQAAALIVAYEPVWAIGTGRTAEPEQADEMCGFIRQVVEDLYGEEAADKVLILYGGSVKPSNASELLNMGDIDGALVGGASLVPEDFIQIVNF